MTSVGSGRYRLEHRIASGGMGEVWRGADTSLGRPVAVKLLHRNLSDDPTFRARFEAEARHAAALHDPHIATVFDFGDDVDEQGAHRAFLVMEYVDGQPLSALLRRAIPPDQAARLVAQAADGLAVAHAAGIVHRDVKPANLLVTPDGRVKITDFGVARALSGSTLTETGTVIGTASYLAPEVAEGKEATPQSDIYSLGIVLYECLAGRRPFTGDNPVAIAMAQVRSEPPPLPESVSPGLRALVVQALAKEPSQRPAGAAAFATQLRDALGPAESSAATQPLPVAVPAGSTGVLPVSDPDDELARPRGRVGPWPWIAAAVAIALIVGVAVAITGLVGDSDGTSDRPQEQRPSAGPTEETGTGEPDPTSEPATTEPTTTEPTTTEPTTTEPTTTEPTTTEPTTTEPTTTEPTTTEPTTTEPASVTLEADDYVGDEAADVAKELRELGLRPSREFVDGDGERGTVADVAPTGEVPVDSAVTVYVWRSQGKPSESGSEDKDDD